MGLEETVFENERGQKVTMAKVTLDKTAINSQSIQGFPEAIVSGCGVMLPNPLSKEYVGYAAPLPGADEYSMAEGRAIARHKAYLHMYAAQNENIDAMVDELQGRINQLLESKRQNKRKIAKIEKMLKDARRKA